MWDFAFGPLLPSSRHYFDKTALDTQHHNMLGGSLFLTCGLSKYCTFKFCYGTTQNHTMSQVVFRWKNVLSPCQRCGCYSNVRVCKELNDVVMMHIVQVAPPSVTLKHRLLLHYNTLLVRLVLVFTYTPLGPAGRRGSVALWLFPWGLRWWDYQALQINNRTGQKLRQNTPQETVI